MNPIVLHIISGQILFSGIGLILLTTGLALWKPSFRRLSLGLLFLGVAGVGLASAALPIGLYLLAAFSTAGFLVCLLHKSSLRLRRLYAMSVIFSWLLIAGLEWSYTRMPKLESRVKTVAVIGDSLSAGMGGEAEGTLWTEQLGTMTTTEVTNLAVAGAKTSGGLKQFTNYEHLTPHYDLLLIEMGGNDLLGGTSVSQYRQDLANLLASLPNEQISQTVVFELPLLPGFYRYGAVQRELCAKFKIPMIPKCVLAEVIAGEGNTTDGLDLSSQGRETLARRVAKIFPE